MTPKADATAWYDGLTRQQLDHDAAAVLVAEWEGVVAGFTYGQIMQRPTLREGDCGYVADLCVAGQYRGRGIGRKLFYALRVWFAKQGIKHIEVQVVRGNPASQAFWRKM